MVFFDIKLPLNIEQNPSKTTHNRTGLKSCLFHGGAYNRARNGQ